MSQVVKSIVSFASAAFVAVLVQELSIAPWIMWTLSILAGTGVGIGVQTVLDQL